MLNQFAVEIPTLPVNRGYSLNILLLRIIEAFIRIAATQRRAARYLGYIWYIRKRFCKSTSFLFSSLLSRIELEIFKISLFLAMRCRKFLRSIVNRLSVPYGMRISVEKRFFTMRRNLLQHIPRNCLRFP